jgi:Arc/MetJ-type ribon-helix-helix transcriptional regulator
MSIEHKVTIRLPGDDYEKIEQLIPNKFMNISDALRHAVRMMLDKEVKQ